MTELRSGTSPPPVRMPIRFFAMTTPLRHVPGLLWRRASGSGGKPLRRWICSLAQPLDDLLDDLARMRNDRDHDCMFVRLRLLEARKLAVEQRGRHEMRVACREPPGDQVPIALEIDEADIGAATDQDIAIGTLERRASDGAMIPDAPRRVDPGGDAVQPGPAILVGERHAAVHLL